MKRAANFKTVAAGARAEIMTVSAVALYLRCHPNSVYGLLKRKQIPAFKLAGDWRFFRSLIDDWIARQEADSIPPVTKGRKPKVN